MPGMRRTVRLDRLSGVRAHVSASRLVSAAALLKAATTEPIDADSAPLRLTMIRTLLAVASAIGALTIAAGTADAAQAPRALMPIDFERSAEFAWLRKKVLARRPLDDMTQAATWRFTGTGTLTFPVEPRLGDMRALRVDMQMFSAAPAPTSNRLSSINLRRPFDSEDWRAYNRISMWIRPDASGFPAIPLQIGLHNDGAEKVPDRYNREGTHYVTLAPTGWQQVVWEIEPLARDRVTLLEIGYWVNKMLAGLDGLVRDRGALCRVSEAHGDDDCAVRCPAVVRLPCGR
jgi:hypothetical protein